jgi:nitrite reductase/ring-hydroxylating ferredoxin subunit
MQLTVTPAVLRSDSADQQSLLEGIRMRFEVGPASEIPPGARKTVYPTAGPGIGVFNVNGTYYAVKNTCPHMGAPLCMGVLTGTTTMKLQPDGRVGMEWIRDGEILKCPWHHWEFDLTTGRTVFPARWRVATYQVTVDEEPEESLPDEAEIPRVETYPVVVRDATVYLELGNSVASSTDQAVTEGKA